MQIGALLIAFILAAVSYAQQPLISRKATGNDKTLVCAHRGRLTSGEPENSLRVIQRTHQAGINAVEFDLRESKDGVIFLSHDQTLDRTTNGLGNIGEYTAEQLKHVLLRDPASGKPGQPITRFDDLLRWAQGTRLELLVDLKNTQPRDATNLIRRYGLLQRVILLTFDSKTTEAALAADASVLVSVLVQSSKEVDEALARADGHPIAFYVPGSANATLFEYARDTGRIVVSDALSSLDHRAQTQGTAAYIDFLRKHPTDITVTDHPLLLRQAADKL
jgi:glycerophosphoryl diester phosphodiesterase